MASHTIYHGKNNYQTNLDFLKEYSKENELNLSICQLKEIAHRFSVWEEENVYRFENGYEDFRDEVVWMDYDEILENVYRESRTSIRKTIMAKRLQLFVFSKIVFYYKSTTIRKLKSISMAKFQIYTYMFRPVMENPMELPFEEFQQINVQESLDRKQELTDEFLSGDENLKFELNGIEYEYKTYIRQGGIYVFRIANNGHQPAEVENDFKVVKQKNHPSCLVIIDNRKDRQVIAVECKSKKPAFGKKTPLTNIIEFTLRKALLNYRLTLDITAKYHTSEFWQVVDDSMKLKGIEQVDFPFAYPNLPVVSDMVGDYMNNIARQTNSEPTLHLKGQNKESICLSREDLWLLSAIKACAASGRPILIKPKGSACRKIGVDSPVYEEIADTALIDLDKKDWFDTKYQTIVEFLNTIKLVYE